MVTTQTEKYECSYCNTEHETYNEALECSKECALDNMEMPISTPECFTCEICGDEFHKYKHAKDCEKDHIQSKDKYYVEQQRKLSFEKLAIAAKHIHQTKLYS